jgi:hypothetical protein
MARSPPASLHSTAFVIPIRDHAEPDDLFRWPVFANLRIGATRPSDDAIVGVSEHLRRSLRQSSRLKVSRFKRHYAVTSFLEGLDDVQELSGHCDGNSTPRRRESRESATA